jgi:GT2 family glycosyltransferase
LAGAPLTTTSVVVVSWRPGDWLKTCLASVTSQADEVVVVDNGSEGARASAIARSAGAEVVRLPQNRGFAHAANLGAARTRGEVIGFLNDDAVAGPAWLRRARELLGDRWVGAVGPKVRLAGWYREVVLEDEEWFAPGDSRPLGRRVTSVSYGGEEMLTRAVGPGLYRLESDPQTGARWRWGAGRRPFYLPAKGPEDLAEVQVNKQPVPAGPLVRLVNSAGLFLDRRGYAGDIGAYAPDDGRFDGLAERFAVAGTAFVARRETWRQLGGFASPFFAYYEDVDWCWRARLAGMRVLYDGAAEVDHRLSQSSGGEHEPWVRVTAERNRTLTMVRNGPRSLVLSALAQRVKEGPDAGVRAAIARLLPWALATRIALAPHRRLSPEEVWAKWAGWQTTWPDGPAQAQASPAQAPALTALTALSGCP